MKHCVKGFHYSGDYQRCKDFVDYHELIIASGDSQWLGRGMYFWDNYGNALSWRRYKGGDSIPVERCIVTADISMDDSVLDLTDEITQGKLTKLVLAAQGEKGFPERAKLEDEQSLGEVLDFLMYRSRFRDNLKEIKTVKASSGHNRLRKKNAVLSELCWPKWPRVTFDTKIEYCVKDVSAIGTQEWVHSES